MREYECPLFPCCDSRQCEGFLEHCVIGVYRPWRCSHSGEQSEDVGAGPRGVSEHHEEDGRDATRAVPQLPPKVRF